MNTAPTPAVAEFWNQRFAEPGFKYGTAPNAFLQACWAQPGSAPPPDAPVLVPGDGEGRNGVWLAQQGHPVLAVDAAEVGLAKARALADQAGPTVADRYRTAQADLAEWSPQAGQWGAVVLIYTHLPSTIRRSAHRRLALGLRPEGLLVLEAFHPQQLGCASGGPRDLDMLYTLAQLREDFAGLLEETHASEGETTLAEGPGHQGLAWVTRWVGRRPAAR